MKRKRPVKSEDSTSKIISLSSSKKWKPVALDSSEMCESDWFNFGGLEEMATDTVNSCQHKYSVGKKGGESITSNSKSLKSRRRKAKQLIRKGRKTTSITHIAVSENSEPGGTSRRDTSAGSGSSKTTGKTAERSNNKNSKMKNKRGWSSVTGCSVPVGGDHGNLDMSKWTELLVPTPIIGGLSALGFETPTHIQSLSLSAAIRDRADVIGAAETGSGKTLAFGVPMVTRILEYGDREGVLGLVLTPTRELAVQVGNHLEAVAAPCGLRVCVLVGGISVEKQRRRLSERPGLVVATPGRLWQLVSEGCEHAATVRDCVCLAVDEADRLTEKGHFEELHNLLEYLRHSRNAFERQTFVFSATLTRTHDKPFRKSSTRRFDKQDKLNLLISSLNLKENRKVIDLTDRKGTVGTLKESRIQCELSDKDSLLYYLLLAHPGRTLVFANSVSCVRRLVSLLRLLQRRPLPLYAEMPQKERLRSLERFAESPEGLLVATDVAARGLDVVNVDHIVHYQVPRTTETYIHRSGRTARANKQGVSIMLMAAEDLPFYKRIVKALNSGMDVESFPVDPGYLRPIRRLVSDVRELESREHRFKKRRQEVRWMAAAAEGVGVDVEDGGGVDDWIAVGKHLAKQRRDIVARLAGTIVPERVGVSGAIQPETELGRNSAISVLKQD